MTASLIVHGLPAFANRDRNPYNALLSEALAARGVDVRDFDPSVPAPHVVHVHWPESHLNHRRWLRAAPRTGRSLLTLGAARRHGARLVWTVHNLGSHEQRYPRTEALFWRRFLPLVDGWIALNEEAAALAVDRWPALAGKPHAVVAHGHYRGVYPTTGVTRSEARRRLGVDSASRVLAFVGRIKAYKGVPGLLAAFRDVDDPSARLVVAGRIETPALGDELRVSAAADERIVLHDGVVPDDELQTYFAAADLVVAPFESILNSGSVLLALSFDRPVLVPSLGSMPSLAATAGHEWVRLYDGPLTASLLRDELHAAASVTGAPDLDAFDWSRIAEGTERLYREVVATRR